MTANRTPSDRHVGAVKRFAESRMAAGHAAFSMAELVSETGLSASAASGQIYRLHPRIVRVSPAHPFFVSLAPDHLSRGSPPVDWWLGDYFRWLKRPYYVALQSAAGTYGSNPQAIQVIQVMTDLPRRPLTVGQLRVTFFVKRKLKNTPIQQVTNAFAPTCVSTPAATVFDLIRYAPRIGGIGRAIETLRPLLALITPSELRAVLAAENQTATAQRMGYVLEKAGQPQLAKVVDHWLPDRRPTIPLTVASAGGPRSQAPLPWRVIDNSREFEP
jgi:hypothetical protein